MTNTYSMVRKEPIEFERKVQTEDDFGTKGTLGVVARMLAEIEPMKSSKLLEANQETIRQGYIMKIWASKDFEPAVDDIIRFRDERLKLTGYRYEDMRRLRYVLTVLEEAPGGNGSNNA